MDLTRLTTTLLSKVEQFGSKKEEAHIVSSANVFVYFAFVLAVMFLTIHIAKKGVNGRVFKGWLAGAAEQLYLFIENMVVGTMGAGGRKYMPFIATFWLVIFFANVISLFFPHSPTADLSFNLGMALISIGYVQYQGIRANGFFGHIKHFAGPKLGGAMVIISGMIFIIEIISEVLKNLSLSLRLYGNIYGGHEAAEAISNLAGQAMHLNWFPAGTLLVPIKLLACVVQAMIFSLLTCVYISLVSHHDHDESHDLEAAGAH
ncbi:MAG: F0F1 ATP synthase subunit A [Armatimonadota bacterium]